MRHLRLIGSLQECSLQLHGASVVLNPLAVEHSMQWLTLAVEHSMQRAVTVSHVAVWKPRLGGTRFAVEGFGVALSTGLCSHWRWL